MRSVLIGSVGSSNIMLEAMISTHFPVDRVFSVDEKYSDNISGYCPIHELAAENGIPYTKFHKINDEENIRLIKEIDPDFIFVIGLSQLVSQEIIEAAKVGVIGFHPAPLPKMRGRAANVWEVLLGLHEVKCSVFFIDQGVDSGDILGQQEFIIEDTDYASDVSRKIEDAAGILFRRVLKQILDGTYERIKQNEEEATYTLKRTPGDGQIDWNSPIADIHRLIRAVSRPYPGAFGMYDSKHQIIIWRAEKCENTKYIGMNGQIAEISGNEMLVVCRDGLLRVTEYKNVDEVKLFVGHKLK